MISLKQLRYFEAVAREGAIGRAAERCAVTQPALSMQIQDLERALGAPLLERLPRGVRLTEAGREVAERARGVLLAVDDLAAAARRHSEGLGGPIRLGVIPTVAPYLLPAALRRWRAAHPEAVVEIRESRTDALLSELSAGDLDLALVALPAGRDEFEEAVLTEDRILLATPAEAPFRGAADIAQEPATLAAQRLLVLEEGHCLRDQSLALLPGGGGCEVSRYGASSLSTLVQMTAGGMGATLLPEMSLSVEAVGRKVAIQRFVGPEPARRIGLVWRRVSPRRAAFQEIAALFAP